MPEGLHYMREEEFPRPFIEKGIVFILPDKLKNFRKNLYHVRRRQDDDSALYVPLFRARCVLESEPRPEGMSGPFPVYPFYTRVARNRRHYLDYYMLFLFAGQSDLARFRNLTA
ncbi:MAG: hypothetical protein ABF876_06550 [Acetobacter aceti]|uniref:Uncharacterized protein n=2 Tax=Acetobacter aceti TaxID=435 RepID=A0A1U9KGX5_ACEAC|nr:hypothetical protein [Acetobacter aceti]AQS84987.1 hypothetical protein A0U92_09580 [Acetobacter aceti]